MNIQQFRRIFSRHKRTFYGLLLVMFMAGTLVPVVSARTTNALTGPFNYAEALQKSIYFYDAEKSGPGITGGRLEWRGDSEPSDSVVPLNSVRTNLSAGFIEANRAVLDPDGNGTMDLSGGFHDAGDHVKFGLPQGYTISTLGWSYYEFKDAFVASGQQAHMLEELKWGTDYLLRATFRNSSGEVIAFAYQLGEGSIDHAIWAPSELKRDVRPAYFATSEAHASDQAAEGAASLAVMSLNYSDIDPAYAAKCLDTAKALYAFAKANRGLGYSGGFYNSSFDEDELTWAATWLYTATNDQQYLTDIGGPDPVTGVYSGFLKKVISTSQDRWQNTWVHSWDTVWGGVFIRLATLFPNNALYDYSARWNIEYWSGGAVPHQDVNDHNYLARTPAGFAFRDTWGSARYNAAAQLSALAYAKNKNRPDMAAWAKSQMDYIMGNNPMGYSYIVGFPSPAQSAQHPHHRDAHGSPNNNMANPVNHKHILWGALVGGPDSSDVHKDLITDFVSNEVAIDYNAGLVGALAGLYEFYGTGQQPLANFPPLEPAETAYFTQAKSEQENNQRSQITIRTNAIPTHPPHFVTGLTARYFFNISEMLAVGQSISNVSILVSYDEHKENYGTATPVNGPIAWDAANGIYYIEIDYSAFSIYGKRDLQVGLLAAPASDSSPHWDPVNDWSHQALNTAAIGDTQYIPLYINGVKVFGLEPGGSVITNTPTHTLTPVITNTLTRTSTTTPALTATRTATRTRTNTRTITPGGPTLTRTRTSTTVPATFTPTRTPVTPTATNTPVTPTATNTPVAPTPTTPSVSCSPVTATISAPFSQDGAGTFCWQSSNLGNYINSWNMTSLTINGVNVSNTYLASGSYPAKAGGFWYVTYVSSVAWSHFEAK